MNPHCQVQNCCLLCLLYVTVPVLPLSVSSAFLLGPVPTTRKNIGSGKSKEETDRKPLYHLMFSFFTISFSQYFYGEQCNFKSRHLEIYPMFLSFHFLTVAFSAALTFYFAYGLWVPFHPFPLFFAWLPAPHALEKGYTRGR